MKALSIQPFYATMIAMGCNGSNFAVGRQIIEDGY